jgi:hypothetical protein
VLAAVQQLKAVRPPAGFDGASQLVEAIALIAPVTKPGDELLILSDMVQSSSLTGDFTKPTTEMDAAGIDRILATLTQSALLPDLTGRTIVAPYPHQYGTRVSTMTARRRVAIKTFWTTYAERTHAALRYGGGDRGA